MRLRHEPGGYSSVTAELAWKFQPPVGFPKIQVIFSGPLQPNPDLHEGNWEAWADTGLVQKRQVLSDATASPGQVLMTAKNGVIQSTDPPFIRYSEVIPDLYDSLGKPIAPFEIPLNNL